MSEHEFSGDERILDAYAVAPPPYDPLAGLSDEQRAQLYFDSMGQGTLLAGREKPFMRELDEITSEGALHRYRAQVEIETLIYFAEHGPIADQIAVSEERKQTLRTLYSPEKFDPKIVVQLDHLGYKGNPPLEHDVKAVEVYLGELLDGGGLGDLKQWVHFGMTSEDTNNLAYNLMLRDATNKVVVPSVARVADRLAHLTAIYTDTPALGITHAQKASPTTVGKQFGYHLHNITEVVSGLEDQRLTGKFSGAVGNHNPMTVLFPNFDYDAYARDFVESQGFEYSSIENQRNNHLAVSEFLNTISQLAVVGKDIAQNSWLKILDGILRQKLVAGERGSSTMSHKINPWRLENAESLFEQALGLASRASEGLVASRHERDLSDHDWQRAFGDILGRVVVGYDYFAIQLDRLTVDKELAQKALAGSAEVLSELVQTAGRVSGDPEAYDRVVELTQGRQLDGLGIKGVIEEALPTGDLRNRVLAVTSETYTGVAAEKAREAVVGWHAAKGIVRRGLLDESTSVDAVLFDFDNTLHFGDKDELFARLSAIAEQLGSGFTEEEIREFGNRSDYLEMRKLMVEEHNRRLGAGIAEDDFQAANDLVTGQFDHLLKPAPNAVEILGQLRDSGKKVGLVTTRGNKSRDRLLKHHGMFDSFDIIVGRGDAERRKPHPHPLVLALDGLGISTDLTRRVLFVGDSQIEDIGAGNALSMKTALVNQVPLDRFGPRPTHHWTSLEPLARRYTR